VERKCSGLRASKRSLQYRPSFDNGESALVGMNFGQAFHAVVLTCGEREKF
jgi:hypothetical protein